MTKKNIQSGTRRSGQIAQAIRVRAASCLACLYLLLSVFATLHPHGMGVSDFGKASAACASHSVSPVEATAGDEPTTIALDRSETALPTIAAPDCPVCDFLAQPVTAASVPPALLVSLAQTDIPAPPVRAVVYKPFRFCDRSASRAPPAISSLLA